MFSNQVSAGRLLAVVTILIGATAAAAAPAPEGPSAEDQAKLRKQALALNDVTGDDVVAEQIRTLVEQAAGTRKLLTVASSLAREKEPPFNFNGAYILARAAKELKDADASQRFYQICWEQARKVQSPRKIFQVLREDSANTKRRIADAVRETKGKDKGLGFATSYALARAAQSLRDVESSQTLYRVAIEEADDEFQQTRDGDKLGQAYTGLVTLLFDNKKFDETEKLCREFLEKRGEARDEKFFQRKMVILQLLIQTLAKQTKFDEANRLLNNLLKLQPDNWLTLELKGSVQREAGEYNEAAKTYEDVLDRINKDETLGKEEKAELGNTIRYTLSNVYLELKKIDKVGEQLEALLAHEPNNPTYLNDLGYIWADHDMNLDKAEEMIRKAIAEDRKQRRKPGDDLKAEDDKDNAAYLDSLGWVLFKKKKFQEAKAPLLEAVKDKEGQQIEILDHLADVHMALGEKAEAIAAWKKAIETASPSKRDQARKVEVEKKLKAAE